MTEHSMKHLDHIRQVAEEDLAYVDEKDRSYGGSWKKRGGVGAFMMLARKWDRLESMLSGTHKFDVFGAISDLGGGTEKQGADGTVLAEIRDLRRYLMLVEAEMIARGVLPSNQGLGTPTTAAKGMFHLTNTDGPSQRCYDVGHGRVCEGDSVVIYYDHGSPQMMGIVKNIRDDGDAVVNCGTSGIRTARWHNVRPSRATNGLERRVPRFYGARTMTDPNTTSCGDGSESSQRTPGDGGQHASLSPWIVSSTFFDRHRITDELRDKFWRPIGGSGFYALEPHVESATMPRILQSCYDMRGDHFVIRMGRVPPDARDHFPVLRRELNMSEHERLPEWQRPFYTWIENENKLRLSDQYLSWGPEF